MSNQQGSSQAELTRIQLTWDEQNRGVTVTPKDKDRFCLSVGEAIEACRAHTQREKFSLQFQVLLDMLGEWVESRRGQIQDAIVTLQEDSILFLVVRKETAYDRQFEDDLTDLDVLVAQHPQLDLIRLNVLALPNCSDEARASFISPVLFLVYRHAE